ncbi:GIY-YIG nuclease family protein [Adhaeribacter rhizoryzae]|uniref:GIY-YIG nuclease family protein n=1 Tax=Adhaeribacter rhizoryzae TaxID=2607907 RepID=A0A5M6D9I0_9BACT|nr:GIY-YIG nuclease family protein [Adhaeribacter rhizoryzae]KAA5544023.1 GIY-YIG nuclease family protein [Adhaeribacter rhizoryzae]
MWNRNYFVYITTNPRKTVFYVGMTNDLERRVAEHKENRGKPGTFAGKYYCYKLVYYERYTHIKHAIEREKEIKLISREEKEKLIQRDNPLLLELIIRV